MEAPRTLNLLLSALFSNSTLMTWQILQEKSGSTLVKLRFAGQDGVDADTGLDKCQTNQVFKRKPVSQIRRDRQRSETFRDKRFTRSQAKNIGDGHLEMENLRHGEEEVIGETDLRVEYPKLDPLAAPFSPNPVIHAIPETSPASLPPPPAPCVLTPAPEDTSTVVDIPMPSPDTALCDVISLEPEEEAADDDGSLSDTSTSDSDFGCDNPSCSYGPGGLPGSDVGIFVCNVCSDVYTCEHCLDNGKHKRHKRNMTPVIN